MYKLILLRKKKEKRKNLIFQVLFQGEVDLTIFFPTDKLNEMGSLHDHKDNGR